MPRPQHDAIARPSAARRHPPQFHAIAIDLLIRLAPRRQDQRVVRRAHDDRVGETLSEVNFRPPFGTVIGANRTTISERLVVWIVDDVQVTLAVCDQRRAGMIVLTGTDRHWRRPDTGAAIE